MWLEVLRAVAPLLAALLAAGVGAWVAHKFGSIQADIARRQAATAAASAETARNKLRLDLFDRRLKIYDGIEKMITNIIRNRRIKIDEYIEYKQNLQSGNWLLDEEVYKYLNGNILDTVTEIYNDLVAIEKLSDHEQIAVMDDKISDAIASLYDQKEKIDALFSQYLHFRA